MKVVPFCLLVISGIVAAATAEAGDSMGRSATGKLHSLLQLRPGLWEFSDVPTVSGDTIMPQSMLTHIPAADRPRSMVEFRKSLSESTRVRECISQTKFESRVFMPESGCTNKISANSPSRLEVQTECRAESGALKQHTIRKVVASDPTNVVTAFHAVSNQGSRTMTVDSISRGHWLSASCGNLQGIQILP